MLLSIIYHIYKANDQDIINSINKVLSNRKSGINYVEFNKHKFENIDDINQIIESVINQITK